MDIAECPFYQVAKGTARIAAARWQYKHFPAGRSNRGRLDIQLDRRSKESGRRAIEIAARVAKPAWRVGVIREGGLRSF